MLYNKLASNWEPLPESAEKHLDYKGFNNRSLTMHEESSLHSDACFIVIATLVL